MLRLMLADDEQYERDYLEKVIKESYPTLLKVVCKAANGVELMEKLDECNPQIILLDVRMPQMDGLETAKRIREKYPDVQMIIVSAYSDFAYAKRALKLGISEYLLKPYLDAELRAVLDRIIARIREKEDALSMLSYTNGKGEDFVFDIHKDMEKDFLWNAFFKRKPVNPEIWEERGIAQSWLKVVLISTSALTQMGDFSKEVLENYFHMEGVTVWNTIWMNQMILCLFSDQKDIFTELNSCIRRARNYLEKEHTIPVVCGVSGVYEGPKHLAAAYEEAASFILEFSQPRERWEFTETTEGMKKICELEDDIIASLANQDKKQSQEKLLMLVEILEKGLDYQDTSVKWNFGRSLLTIIRGIDQMPDRQVERAEVLAQLGKLEQLNFNGDNLKYHMDFFADMKVKKSE